LKVTLISMVFPHPKRGVWPGIERHVGELSRALIREGVGVSVITTFWNGGSERDTWEGVEIYRVHDARRRWGRSAYLLNWHIRSFGWSLLQHKALLQSSDAIHAFVGLSSYRDLARLGVPLFASFPHRQKPDRLYDALFQIGDYRTERRFFPLTAAVFAGSEEARRVLLSEYRLEPSRVHVVPLGVNGEVFRPPAKPRPRVPYEERKEGLRLLYVGPLVKRKSLDTLVEALPLVLASPVPCRLSFVGRGPDEPILRSLAERHGVAEKVDFAGYVEEPALVDWYQGSDLFVFPSTQEGFGLVLAEAMACGLPIVATTVPPMPEVIGDAGLLVPPADPAAMAAAIVKLARDVDLRERMSREGRRRVEERYVWSRVARETLQKYRSATAAKLGVG
jgi:glycosyltransferase involved in cell wall biosynthesis